MGWLSRWLGPVKEDTTIVYDKAFTNTNEVVNLKTGIFTVPISGFYFLIINVGRNIGSGEIGPSVDLYINGNTTTVFGVYECCREDEYDSVTNSAIIELKAGDLVRFALQDDYQVYSSLWAETNFTGFLIFQTCSSQEVNVNAYNV
ncbi:complement C1q tumor necrosis factor-related protein 3-like [Glandiceps talaboti]